MTKKKSTKRALISSLLILAMCFTMLAGTTFAWFTDSVSSGNNRIVAGNLKIGVYGGADYDASIDQLADLFVAPANTTKGLWEPGHVEVAYLKVENLGTLALKYKVSASTANEVTGVNANDGVIKLSEILDVAVVESDSPISFASREAALAAITGNTKLGDLAGMGEYALAVGASKYIAVIISMDKDIGNEANYKVGTTAPSIDFAVSVVATQDTVEFDGFDDQYDANALYPDAVTVGTRAALEEALADFQPGDVIVLTADITDAAVALPDGAIIDGNGHVLNATITGDKDIKLINVNSKLVKATNFTGTLEFDGGTLSTADEDNGTDGSAPFSYLSGNTGEGTFIFKGMEITAGATKGIKISGAKEVVIEDCVFDADKMSHGANGRIYDLRSMSMIDIQERNEAATGPMAVTIKNCTFIGAPQGNLHQGFADSDTAAAIKLKAEIQGFSSVTITGNTFTGCYRDIAVGTNLLIEGSNNYYTGGKTVTELKLASNNVEDTTIWNISGNHTNAANANKGYCVAKNDNAAYADTTIGAIIGGAAVYNTYKTDIFTKTENGATTASAVIAYLNTLTA